MMGLDDLAVAAGILGAEYVYHRWIDPPDPPKVPPPANALAIPRTDAGTPYPIFFGRCRVKSSVLAWVSKAKAKIGTGFSPAVNAQYVYGADILLIIGLPFVGGANVVRYMWAGELQLAAGPPGLSGQTGHGGSGTNDTCLVGTAAGLDGNTGPIYGTAEVLDGRSTQTLVDGTLAPITFAAKRMIDDGVTAANIPGYRNYMSVFLCAPNFAAPGGDRFWVGSQPQVDAYSFEVQTLPLTYFGPNQQVTEPSSGDIGVTNGDANPIDVLYEILTGSTKLGLSPAVLDGTSFYAAATTLDGEGLGFSRCWDRGETASQMIAELMRYIDGVLRVDPTTGLISVKLVRSDYTVSALPQINPDNCQELQGFAAGGWTAITNKVDVSYTSRSDGYRDGSASAQNQANAVGQNNEVYEVSLQYPGCCEQGVADRLASREIYARSRPLMKCSAIVNRSFYAVLPGDVVRVKWPEWGLNDVVFRVANVSRGTLENGAIKLDLLQDIYYVWRGASVGPPHPVSTGTLAGGTL
jgi:hypothetical protein